MSEKEQRLLELRVELLELELANKKAPNPKILNSKEGIWTSPLLLGIVGATATAIVGLVANQSQLKASRQLERDKLESSLILKAVEASDASQRRAALQFLVKAGLISDQGQKIEALKQDEVPQIKNQVPSVPEVAPSPVELVDDMNAADKQRRLSAVSQLIKGYGTSSQAVDLAIGWLEMPKLESLSASGRINVLVFLRNTNEVAWSAENVARAEKAIQNIRVRRGAGVEIGKDTDEALKVLTETLAKFRARNAEQ